MDSEGEGRDMSPPSLGSRRPLATASHRWLSEKHPLQSMNRRIVALCVSLLAAAAGIDAFLIEPDWIEVTHHQVVAPIMSPLKIAHLTDIHTKGLGRREKRMLALLEKEQPDLIAIT